MAKRGRGWQPPAGPWREGNELAQWLRDLLGQHELSVRDAAAKIPYSRDTICRHLNGRHRPEWKFVQALILTCLPSDKIGQQRLLADPAKAHPVEPQRRAVSAEPAEHSQLINRILDRDDRHIDDLRKQRAALIDKLREAKQQKRRLEKLGEDNSPAVNQLRRVKSQMTALCGEIKAVLQHLEEAQLPRRISDAATPPDETHRGQGTSGAHPSEEGDPGRCAVRPPRHE